MVGAAHSSGAELMESPDGSDTGCERRKEATDNPKAFVLTCRRRRSTAFTETRKAVGRAV